MKLPLTSLGLHLYISAFLNSIWTNFTKNSDKNIRLGTFSDVGESDRENSKCATTAGLKSKPRCFSTQTQLSDYNTKLCLRNVYVLIFFSINFQAFDWSWMCEDGPVFKSHTVATQCVLVSEWRSQTPELPEGNAWLLLVCTSYWKRDGGRIYCAREEKIHFFFLWMYYLLQVMVPKRRNEISELKKPKT